MTKTFCDICGKELLTTRNTVKPVELPKDLGRIVFDLQTDCDLCICCFFDIIAETDPRNQVKPTQHE